MPIGGGVVSAGPAMKNLIAQHRKAQGAIRSGTRRELFDQLDVCLAILPWSDQ